MNADACDHLHKAATLVEAACVHIIEARACVAASPLPPELWQRPDFERELETALVLATKLHTWGTP